MMQSAESKWPFYEMYLGPKFTVNESEKKKDFNNLKNLSGEKLYNLESKSIVFAVATSSFL